MTISELQAHFDEFCRTNPNTTVVYASQTDNAGSTDHQGAPEDILATLVSMIKHASEAAAGSFPDIQQGILQ